MHVWVCGSPENRKVATAIWAASPKQSLERGVTTVDTEGNESMDGLFSRVLNAVDLHHGEYSHDPVWSVLHIYGIPPTPRIREALKQYHAEVVEERNDCFIASRDVGP
jgi:hypothetical protein